YCFWAIAPPQATSNAKPKRTVVFIIRAQCGHSSRKIDSFLSTIYQFSGEKLRRAVQFLLNLPPPISFFIVSAITTSFALAGLYLVRRKYSADVLKENHEVAAIIFNALDCFTVSCSRLWFLLRGAGTTTPQRTSNWKLMRSLTFITSQAYSPTRRVK